MRVRWGILLLLLSACEGAPVATAPTSAPVSGVVAPPPTAVIAPADATQTALANTVAQLFEGTAAAGTATRSVQIANPSPIPPTPLPDLDQDPAEVARRFLTATFEGDGATLARYTCSRDTEANGLAGALVTMFMGTTNAFLSEFVPGAVFGVDFSDVTFTVVNQSGSTATVTVYGQVNVTVGSGFKQGNLDMQIPLIYEGGRWRTCGATR